MTGGQRICASRYRSQTVKDALAWLNSHSRAGGGEPLLERRISPLLDANQSIVVERDQDEAPQIPAAGRSVCAEPPGAHEDGGCSDLLAGQDPQLPPSSRGL